MENPILDYLSIIHNELEEHVTEYDALLAEMDNGIKMPTIGSRNVSLELLDETIKELINLRNEIQNKPLSKLREEYLS